MSKPNTIGLGEYKDEDLIEELKNRGVILYTENKLELAKIEARIDELERADSIYNDDNIPLWQYFDERINQLNGGK